MIEAVMDLSSSLFRLVRQQLTFSLFVQCNAAVITPPTRTHASVQHFSKILSKSANKGGGSPLPHHRFSGTLLSRRGSSKIFAYYIRQMTFCGWQLGLCWQQKLALFIYILVFVGMLFVRFKQCCTFVWISEIAVRLNCTRWVSVSAASKYMYQQRFCCWLLTVDGRQGRRGTDNRWPGGPAASA